MQDIRVEFDRAQAPIAQRLATGIDRLDATILDTETESGSTYFREPLNLVLGLFWDREPGRGDFVAFHFDGRRFEAWDPKTA